MKWEFEYRNAAFVMTVGKSIDVTPSFNKVGLPRSYLDEAVEIQLGPRFTVVNDDSVTGVPIKVLDEFTRYMNFLTFQGARTISADFEVAAESA